LGSKSSLDMVNRILHSRQRVKRTWFRRG
jgi:hypothetical protein